MSDESLDARLRRHFADVDTSAEFQARLMARVAALPAIPAEMLLVRFERRRDAARRSLRREALLNSATAAGVGAALIALVWREGPAVERWVQQVLAVASDPGALTGFVLLALGLGTWVALGRLTGRL